MNAYSFRLPCRPVFLVLSFALLLFLGTSCKKEVEEEPADRGVTFSSITAPPSFNYSLQKRIQLEIMVYNPLGSPQRNIEIQVYQGTEWVDYSDLGGSAVEVPKNMLLSGRTNMDGIFRNSVLLPSNINELHLVAGAFGIPNSATVSIDSANSVNYVFQ